ncbi:tetratricopeptide repeat protein [Candidatus Ozemobacteraceae bacterium]|nr:tetratricopeptide repeat protein [Candidatus Ozemobacteraceae bacterium]
MADFLPKRTPICHAAGTGLVLALSLCLLAGDITPVHAARKKSGTTSTRKKKSEAASATSSSPERYYETIWQRYQIGSTKERQAVVSELKARSKQDPSDGTCHYYLGMMLAEEGGSKSAEEHLRAAAAAFPDSPDVLYCLAEQLLVRHKPEEAAPLYEKIVTLAPNHGGALTRLGLKALDESQYPKALELLTAARAASPDNRETLRGLAIALHHSTKSAEAVELFKTVLALDEKDPEAWMLLGKSYESQGKVSEAADAFDKAKQFGKRDLEIKNLVGYDLARALYATGKIDEAIKEYQKTIRTATDSATGWFELGRLHDDLRDNDAAIDAYKKCFEADEKRGDAVFRIAELYRSDEKLDEALGALELIVRKKDWSEKAKALIEEIKAEKTEGDRDNLMEIAQGGSEEVREKAYQDLLAIDKKDEAALEGLKQLAFERGDLDQVRYYIKELKKAGHLSKDQADIQLNELKYREEAGEDLAVWENRLEEYKKDGDWDKAIEMNTKIRKYAQDQLDYWRRYSPKSKAGLETKSEMMKLTRIRLRLIRETMNDLRKEKAKNK